MRVLQRITPFLFAIIMIFVVITTTQKIHNYQGPTILSISGSTQLAHSLFESLLRGSIFLTVIILMVTFIMFLLSLQKS